MFYNIYSKIIKRVQLYHVLRPSSNTGQEITFSLLWMCVCSFLFYSYPQWYQEYKTCRSCLAKRRMNWKFVEFFSSDIPDHVQIIPLQPIGRFYSTNLPIQFRSLTKSFSACIGAINQWKQHEMLPSDFSYPTGKD